MPAATPASGPLERLRVLEVGGGLAAAYATKLLVDLGASATVLEAAAGCPLRGETSAESKSSPLFEYLRSGCASVVALPAPDDTGQLFALRTNADITIAALPPDQWTELAGATDASPRAPCVLVHVSPFGRTGPRSRRRATGSTLQALAGWPRRIVATDGSPCFAGGNIDAYGAGVHAAVAAMTAWRHATATLSFVEAEVATFECLVGMLPYPTVHAEILAAAGLGEAPAARPLPGVVECADGWIGVNPLNQQGWNDLCEVLELTEFRERLREVVGDAHLTEEFKARSAHWFSSRSGDEVVELMQAIRIPATRVLDGRGLLQHPQLVARDAFVSQPSADFLRPRPSWRFSATPLPTPEKSPDIGSAASARAAAPPHPRRADRPSAWGAGRPGLPYSGLKVFDLSMFWAGPIITMYLASFGADVIKVESHRRPDAFRYSTSSPALGADWWERSPVWQSTNLGKRSLTLDLSQTQGQQLALRFIAQADVLIENFTPRVLGQLGIDEDIACSENPGLIVMRLPGFGSYGPWRDHLAWAPTLEQASGLAHVTGFESGPPIPPGGCADPLGGMHGLLGLQAALEHRDRTGRGQVVEMSQLEALLSMTAEQVIAVSSGGEPPGRRGNRHPKNAPHGIYPCSGPDEWIALAVQDDEWEAVAAVIGRADLLSDPTLADPAQRRLRHDELDAAITAWTSQRSAAVAEAGLVAARVTAATVGYAASLRDDEQLRTRDFFQSIDRAATGTYSYPGWPMRFSFGPSHPHARPAPTLGEHTDELLQDVLGLSPVEIERLHREKVIGDAAAGGL